MNLPSISIIVPVYNVEAYVEDCIRSVMRQTYEGPIECIIVDDCGTDNSMAIVDRLITDYNGPISFKVLHHDHNRGLSAARNTGMDAAKADYIFFLDSDDELIDDCIEKLSKPLENEFYDMVVGDVSGYECDSTHQWRKISFWEMKTSNDMQLKAPSIFKTLGKKWRWSAWGKLYRKEFLINNNLIFKEGLLYEDIPWGYKIACLASSVYIISQSIYKYKFRDGSITHSSDNSKVNESLVTIIMGLGDFSASINVDMAYGLPYIKNILCEVLDQYSYSLSYFVSNYKIIRPHLKIKLRDIVQANHYHIRKIFYDFHFIIPLLIAPYWQFLLCKFHPYISNRRFL